MTAALVASPSTASPSTPVTVTASGFSDLRTRMILDGTVTGGTICSITGGAFSRVITLGSTIGTQTISAEQYVAGAWTEVADVDVTVSGAGPGNVKVVSPGVTSAQVAAYIGNTAYDVIEFTAGTYSGLHVFVRANRGSSHPLLMRPATGAAVIFDGGGGSAGNGFLYLGANVGLPGYPSAVTDYITMDAAGTGGSFTIQNYNIGSTGLIYTGWVAHIEINGIIVRTCTGVTGGGGQYNQSHCLYIASDDTHRSADITANDWDIVFTGTRSMNALQTFHNPNVDGLTAHGWDVDNVHRAGLIYGDGTLIDIDGWTINHADETFDTGETCTGSVKNSTATNSGNTIVGTSPWNNTGITDGGGNSL